MYAPPPPPSAWQVSAQQQQSQTALSMSLPYGVDAPPAALPPIPTDNKRSAGQHNPTICPGDVNNYMGNSNNVSIYGGSYDAGLFGFLPNPVTSAIDAIIHHNEEEEEVNQERTGAEEDENQNTENDVHDSASSLSSSVGSSRHRTNGNPHPRLHVHPIVKTSGYSASTFDPITAALARQQQQLYRGEPRSPLSPRTLQALCNATVEGRHDSFVAQLTPDDILAAPPLALTWYPCVPAGVTQHVDRKRRVDDMPAASTLNAMARHEVDRLAEEREDVRKTGDLVNGGGTGGEDEETDLPLMPLRRARVDLTTDPTTGAVATAPAALQTQTQPSLHAAPAGTEVIKFASTLSSGVSPSKVVLEDTTLDITEEEGQGRSPRTSTVIARADAHRKRERNEPVFEYISHGRRLN